MKMNKNKYKGCCKYSFLFWVKILFLMFCLVSTSFAQVNWDRVSLTRGKVWLTIMNSCQWGNPVNPPSKYYLLDYPGYSTGANLWDHMSYAWSGGYTIYGERNGSGAAYTIGTAFYSSSQYVYPTVASSLIKNYNLEDPAIPAEEVASGASHVIDLDVDVAHESMVWSFPKYDDFIIHEYTITNTGDTPLDNLYFGVRVACWPTMKGDGAIIGNGNFTWNIDNKYGWNEDYDFYYVYDDRSFRWEDEVPLEFNFGPGPETGDIGDPADLFDPNAKTHELLAPGYMAIVCLDSAGANVYQNIGQFLGQQPPFEGQVEPEDIVPRLGTHTPSEILEKITHQQPRLSWDEAHELGVEGGSKYLRMPEVMVTCGPYNDIPPGGSVTVVFAEVLGEMDRAKIVQGGVENVKLLATESKEALFENVKNCFELYNNGYMIDDPPPMTPTNGENSLTLTPIGGGVKVEWTPIPDTYTDPVSGVNDLEGYRVYRSNYFVIGPWELIADIKVEDASIENGMITYSDQGLSLGVGYYYTVTSYDENGNESGKVNANRYPVYALRPPNLEFPQNVYVVPNPFRQHSGLLGTGEALRMEFIGLPAQCTIRIYTLAGELVRKIEHDDGSGSQSWGSILKLDYQVNKWMMYVAPGVYIYYIESNVPEHEGETYIGKFAIIK